MSELTVFLRGFEIDVNVTRAFVQKPMGMRADSDDDCYGYSELEYDVTCVIDDEDNALCASDCQEYADANRDEITDMIWSELEKQS